VLKGQGQGHTAIKMPRSHVASKVHRVLDLGCISMLLLLPACDWLHVVTRFYGRKTHIETSNGTQ